MTKIKHQYHFHFWIWIKKNEKKHRWHFSFNLICHLFWKGGRRAMGMNSKPSFKNVATGTCYWCVTASCYLINFKMHFSFPESDLGLSPQHSSGDAPFFVSSFFKECAVYTKFGLEIVEDRNWCFVSSVPSPTGYWNSLKLLWFFLDNCWTN